MDELWLFTDGASRGNPGDAAIGVVILTPDGRPVAAISEAIGRATNNVAEYTALARGLERARDLGARRVRVHTDSELVVRQIQGVYAVKNAGLVPLHRTVRRLLAGFQEAEVRHVPRERNREADRLANAALDAAPAPGPRPAPAPPPRLRVLQIDAFTREPFTGNPAGLVPEAAGLSDAAMQRVAREMNLSETAFLLPPAAGGDFRLRYFTPTREVDLCGHATVAAFWFLAAEGRLVDRGPFRLETRAGLLPVEVRPGAVMMGQAAPRFRDFEGNLAEVAASLGVPLDEIAAAPLAPGIAYTGLWHLLVPVRTLAAVRGAAPDLPRLARLNEALGVLTTHVFSLGETVTPEAVLHARAFAPLVGVAEDPQTGTASGALGAWLVHRGVLPRPAAPHRSARPGEPPEGGVVRLVMEQGYEVGRPGRIEVEVAVGAAGTVEAVRVGGPAVVVLDGHLLRPEV